MWTIRNQIRVVGTQWAARLLSYAQGLLAVIGLTALVLAVLPYSRQALSGKLSAQPQQSDKMEEEPARLATGKIQPLYSSISQGQEERERRALIEFIAKRYRVSDQAVSGFVAAAYEAGTKFSLDPVLLLAVMAIESRYNPVAESVVGAKGLMQVIPKFHGEKLDEHGGEAALLDPAVNIYVGAQILREYLRRFGQLEIALQVYGGAFDEPTLQYANKVLAEREKLAQIVRRIRSEA